MAFNYEYPYVDVERANSDWLLNQMKVVLADMEEVKEIVSKFDITKSEVIEMIDAAIVVCKKYTDDSINSFENDVMIPYVADALIAFDQTIRTYINAQDEAFYVSQSNRTDAIALDLKDYIDNKVINILEMTDPIDGQTKTIPEVIDDMVETFHRVNALTAGEYDGYDLTANAYDSQLISAYAYDFDGKNQVVH